ncbi:MAG TPA: hypothetical protein VK457_04515 [Chloroflexota bacterium]|nr:hypothetical protein [Chloroflexota bacterium]
MFGWLFEVVGSGRWDHFRTRMRLSPDILFRWRMGKGRPSLDMFLTFCSRLHVEPDGLLDPAAPEWLDPHAIRTASVTKVRAASRNPNQRLDRKHVRTELERALEAEPAFAPALDHIASDLGVGSQLIRYHFAELARAISLRWRSGRRACQQAGRG